LNVFKRILAAALAALVLAAPVSTALAADGKRLDVPKGTLKKMSTFISNFTELRMFNFATDDGSLSEYDLINFGVRHNFVNNFKLFAKTPGDKRGDLTLDGKYVAASVRKYFDMPVKHMSVEGDEFMTSLWDGKKYHVMGSDGEAAYFARVKEAFRLGGGRIRMTGELYSPDGLDDKTYRFEAIAKPYKYGGKDTWAILSLKSDIDG
jgi:hypothetical protein